MEIAVVTDSTSDILPELAAEYGIQVVPNVLTIDNVDYLDGPDITREAFYARIGRIKHIPTTAAPSPEVYTQLYERLFSGGAGAILSFHPAAKLSALFNIATIAAEKWKDRIHIIDSNNASIGLGYQVLHASKAVLRGENLDYILSENARLKSKVRVFALIDTLAYIHHSGRVNWVTASLGSMLGLKAVIELRNGIVHRLGLTRKRNQGLSILKKVVASAGTIREAALLHTTQPSQEEIDLLIRDLPVNPADVMRIPVTPVIGSHVGPACIGYGLVLE